MNYPQYKVKKKGKSPELTVIEKERVATSEFTIKDVVDHMKQLKQARRENESRKSLNQAMANKLRDENKTLFRNKTDDQLRILAAAGRHADQVAECDENIKELNKIIKTYESELPALKELVGYEEKLSTDNSSAPAPKGK